MMSKKLEVVIRKRQRNYCIKYVDPLFRPEKIIHATPIHVRKPVIENLLVDIRRYYDEGEAEVTEADICKHFGCGRQLSPTEKLYGDTCIKHQRKETTLSIIDKHLSL